VGKVKGTISKRYYESFKGRLTSIRELYEQGCVTDEDLLDVENRFYFVEKIYLEQEKKNETIKEKYPDADPEQRAFDSLCEQVGITMQAWGDYAKSPEERENAETVICGLIDDLMKTWDKGCMYYPHPKNPELRFQLVKDLRDKNRRSRAKKRNIADMDAKAPYRGAEALMSDTRQRVQKKKQ